MLENAIVAWLEGLGERELDQPLLALLRAQGFYDVHLVHGGGELGRDIIAKRVDDGAPRQYALQLKAGDLKVRDWREVRLQIDSIRTGGLSHPEFDATLRRVGVLVSSGRLVGDAKLEAQAYREQYAEEMDFEMWDLDRLVELIVSRPEAALAGRDHGPLLAALGAADAHQLDDRAVERFARRWIPEHDGSVSGGDVLEAAVLTARLADAERLDLACLLSLGLLRAAALGASDEAPAPATSDVWCTAAIALFVRYADALWERCDEQLLEPVPFVNRHNEFGFFATYVVRCARTVELLSLLALWRETQPEVDAGPLKSWLARFVAEQPGAAHPLSDRFAASLLAPAVLLADDRELVIQWLRSAVLWVADHYEQPLLGLGSIDADPDQEVGYLLSALEHIDLPRRHDSYLATVILDLLAALRLEYLYRDAQHELQVDALPVVLHVPDSRVALEPDGEGIEIEVGVAYAETLDEDGWSAAHQHADRASWVERSQGTWVALACCSVLRDRHWPGLIRRMAEARVDRESGHDSASKAQAD